MPVWMYHGVQEDYQFNDLVKPENLARLPPLNEQDVSILSTSIAQGGHALLGPEDIENPKRALENGA